MLQGERFQGFGCLIAKCGCRFRNLLITDDHLWRRFAHFKSGAHFRDLRCLLSELGCESLYLFLLLRDRCFEERPPFG
jgi:hypothetical protein